MKNKRREEKDCSTCVCLVLGSTYKSKAAVQDSFAFVAMSTIHTFDIHSYYYIRSDIHIPNHYHIIKDLIVIMYSCRKGSIAHVVHLMITCNVDGLFHIQSHITKVYPFNYLKQQIRLTMCSSTLSYDLQFSGKRHACKPDPQPHQSP